MDKFNQIRHLIRKIESLAEVALLALLYYQTWDKYRPFTGENVFYFRGKIILIGIYVLLIFILFRLCDSFNFGNLKLIEVTVSQWFSVFFANVITYLQLCLIANAMLPVMPMFQLLLIDLVITFVCSYLFTYIFHHTYVKRDMAIVCGSDNAKKIIGQICKES